MSVRRQKGTEASCLNFRASINDSTWELGELETDPLLNGTRGCITPALYDGPAFRSHLSGSTVSRKLE